MSIYFRGYVIWKTESSFKRQNEMEDNKLGKI